MSPDAMVAQNVRCGSDMLTCTSLFSTELFFYKPNYLSALPKARHNLLVGDLNAYFGEVFVGGSLSGPEFSSFLVFGSSSNVEMHAASELLVTWGSG